MSLFQEINLLKPCFDPWYWPFNRESWNVKMTIVEFCMSKIRTFYSVRIINHIFTTLQHIFERIFRRQVDFQCFFQISRFKRFEYHVSVVTKIIIETNQPFNINGLDTQYRPSPIPKGGLKILLKVSFSICDDKCRFLK